MRWLSNGFLLCLFFLPEGHIKWWDVSAGWALRDDPVHGLRFIAEEAVAWRGSLAQGHSEFFSRAVLETWVLSLSVRCSFIQEERMLSLLLVHLLYRLISKAGTDSEENWNLGSNQNKMDHSMWSDYNLKLISFKWSALFWNDHRLGGKRLSFRKILLHISSVSQYHWEITTANILLFHFITL